MMIRIIDLLGRLNVRVGLVPEYNTHLNTLINTDNIESIEERFLTVAIVTVSGREFEVRSNRPQAAIEHARVIMLGN